MVSEILSLESAENSEDFLEKSKVLTKNTGFFMFEEGEWKMKLCCGNCGLPERWCFGPVECFRSGKED